MPSTLLMTGLALIAAFLWCALPAEAALPLVPPGWKTLSSAREANPEVLRGYGRVTATFQELVTPDGKSGVLVTHFATEREANAVTVLAKCLADLTLSPGVTVDTLTVNGRPYRRITVDGGQVYVGVVLGASAYLVAGPDAARVGQFLTASPLCAAPSALTAVTSYPRFLDRFDRNGWGFYGLAGVVDFHNWKKLPGASPDADPLEDLDFCAKHGFRFELWLDEAKFDNAHCLPYQPEAYWMLDEAKKRNLPVSARLYGALPNSWEYSDAFEQPADFLETGWYNGSWQFRTWRHQSWHHQRGQRFLAWQAQQQAKKFVDQEGLQSWMLPIGEVGPDPWYALNGDYSPAATASWRATLREAQGLSLATVSRMYGRETQPFISWDQVPVPEFATFVGLPGLVKDLAGDWHVRWEDPAGAKEWWKGDVNGPGWDVLKKPGSESWFNDDSKRGVKKWCVRDVELPKRWISAKVPLYLYTFLRPSDSGRQNLRTPVYVNGELAGEVGAWGALEVSALLKPGSNRVAISTDTFTGRVFVSTDKPAVFPYLGEARNRLWMLYRSWQLDGPYHMGETILAGMRQVDPNRPVKMMAPIGMGTDRWLKLSNRFGAWPHFTGEGMWYFPWYKRYGYLYGVPGTSEGGGPSDNVTEQENLFQRIFLAGLNSHDQVFLAQDITRRPELKAWYEEHIATLKQLGRYDIAGPQVLIYRSTNVQTFNMPPAYPPTGGATIEVQDPWNWDIGRGTLQTIGQSYLYVDDGGVKDGKLNGYDILLDGGNDTLNEESLAGIAEWVRAGGTFITWPFTGRSTLTKPESWPITALTGCGIKTQRAPGTGTITIKKDQPYLTELAGKSFPDAGSSLDWQKIEHNVLSVELTPGQDSEVVATFENGAPAIVVRRLGAGKVVVLGSAFFRDSKDIQGIWWPGERETTFFRDLLTGLGQPSVNVASDPRVWTQRYRMNNGVDEVVTLVNFADGDRTVTLTATVDRKPSKVYEVTGNTIREVPFTVQGSVVTVKNRLIPHKEVSLYLFRANDAGTAVRHWWSYQQRMWRPVERMPLDLSDVGQGRWGGLTIELAEDWRWSQSPPANWTETGADDTAWKTCALGVMNFAGIDPNQPVYLRKRFTVPPQWFTDGGTTKLALGAFVGLVHPGMWKAGSQIHLNGTLLKDWGQVDYFERDITRLLLPGGNVVAMALKRGDSKFVGVLGTMYAVHSEAPAHRLPLTWQWTASVDGAVKRYTLPGTAPKTAFPPARSFFIPAEWRDKYFVVYYAAGQRTSIVGMMVNGRIARRHHHWFGGNAEIDLTPLLKFGEENSLTPLRAGDVDWDLNTLELRLYPRAETR
jgi:hypothetical protein